MNFYIQCLFVSTSLLKKNNGLYLEKKCNVYSQYYEMMMIISWQTFQMDNLKFQNVILKYESNTLFLFEKVK